MAIDRILVFDLLKLKTLFNYSIKLKINIKKLNAKSSQTLFFF